MRTLFLAALLPLICQVGYAQQPNVYIVKAGEVPIDVLPVEAKYTYPKFKEGTVYLRDGSTSSQKLNYNIALDEMHFISNNKDTLAIADPAIVKSIVIDSSTFYFDKNFVQVIAQANNYKLGVKQFLVQSPYRTHGGYDMATSTSSITTIGNIYSGGQVSRLQVKKDIELEKKSTYFISDPFNHFLKADKKSFLKIFSGRKAMIEEYINANKIDFMKVEDLKKLLNYCVSQY